MEHIFLLEIVHYIWTNKAREKIKTLTDSAQNSHSKHINQIAQQQIEKKWHMYVLLNDFSTKMCGSWSHSYVKTVKHRGNFFSVSRRATFCLKGTDPLKIDQIFNFFLRKVYTFSSSFIWYDNHYRGATRSMSGRGTKVARSLRKEAQCRSDWCVFYFILFYIFFSPFTSLQYLIFSTINCP